MILFSNVFNRVCKKIDLCVRTYSKPLFLSLLIGFGTGLAATEGQAQDKRIVTIDDADFFGSDYRTVKDVDLEGCKWACLQDNQCRAFTFNTSAGWCFLKSDFGELQSFVGAVAGRVVEVRQPRVDLSADRKTELVFLPNTQLDGAETYSRSIANSIRTSDQTADQLRRNGLDALNARNGALAEADFLQLVVLEPGDFEAWVQLTTALLLQNPDNWQDRLDKRKNAVSAAINAYLRAINSQEQAFALDLLGRSLERNEEYKSAIKALRASLALESDANVRRRYEELVAQHGFRIVDHQVDSDSVTPRICLIFSQKLPLGEDLSPYVSVKGAGNLSIETEGNQICADGLEHGARYQVTARSGLPAADGEKLEKSANLSIYVRDRSPSVHFLSRSYVLPSGGKPTIPIISVNTSEIEAGIYRVGNRSVADVLRDNRFLRQLDSYQADQIEDELGEKVWSGIVETENQLNQDITTAIPLSETGIELKPGIYAMTARAKSDRETRWGGSLATQWFLVSDLGLTALTGNNGISANIRSLSSAQALEGVSVRLLAVNNEVLAETSTDTDGFAQFAAGLIRGRGGKAPGVLVAETGEGDYSFLDLRKPAFDLSDRGVEGRPAPGPLDVFAWTDRGIYKAGETVHTQALLRNATATAQENFPLTFVFNRPDGVEHARFTVEDNGLGGHLHDLNLSQSAQQGIWSWNIYADPKGRALAQETFLVEDYQPERVDFELKSDAVSFSRAAPTNVSLDAKFLYGSPASGQSLEGDILVKPVRTLKAFPGYQFGLEGQETYSQRGAIPSGLKTDKAGKLSFEVKLPELPETTLLYEGDLIARLVEAGGRYVERHLDLPVALDSPRIGIKPAFDGGVDEGGPADFSMIVVGVNGQERSATDLSWTLSKIDRRYQWYRLDGRWSFEPITSSRRVASGSIDFKAGQPARLSLPVEWGEYRLDIQGSGDLQTASSVNFNAGWYTADATSETPDYLDVGLDKASYRPGETAKLRLKPQMPGVAVVNVVSGGLIASQVVEVAGDETEVDIPVSDDWGAGAYITASLYRPMDLQEKRMPSRAIGLSWLQVDPGDRVLEVELAAPTRILPETRLEVPVRLANLEQGEKAFLTVAAVDVGILNLTGFETPDPDNWYFGQRRLGTDIRDLYGQLIDRMAGALGRVRSGGDAMGMRLEAPPPDEEPVALFSGLVEMGPDGEALVTFDVPAFNGALKLMAVAWTKDGVGHADQEIEVRSPIVMTASAPAFLAPGDQSRLAIEIDNVDGPAGRYELEVSASEGLLLDGGNTRGTRDFNIDAGAKTLTLMPVRAGDSPIGGEVIASLTGPEGKVFVKRFGLDVKDTQPRIVRSSSFKLASGDNLTLSEDSFDGLRSETVEVTLTAGGAANIDIAGLLAALDRYPYGCTEQTTSRALPLLYLSEVAEAAGLGTDDAIRKRVVKAISSVLANQSASGDFGLWNSYGDGDTWLDAYVTDFLTRSREKGYRVSDLAFTTALDNLENRIAYASDFQNGGEGIAYALYVLARNGRASMGDLRYYFDAKLQSFATPLAKAQIAAGLALYGEQQRATSGFEAALTALPNDKQQTYRDDFGSVLRDSAGVADYVVSASMGDSLEKQAVDLLRTAQDKTASRSTQDMAWLLLAAQALNDSAESARISVRGEETPGRLAWSLTGTSLADAAAEIKNNGPSATDLLVSIAGQPLTPEPSGGKDYSIERTVYDLNGTPVNPDAVPVNTRLAVVLTVRALTDQPGRLMVVDRLPAGLVIDNPRLVRSGDVGGLSFLSTIDQPEHSAFYQDRFEVAVDQTRQSGRELTFAYLARAATPGDFVHPPATVEDMYRPDRQAITDTDRFIVLGPTR
ncbi:MAG: alpha-2-macroglobulin family protein [Roseibium sp.]|uniref:alpha-2-macroglobulin family protein n=1 Tax=Roseibium sp. TaxID=1936156 RepID=UPI002629D178|nr:alpha-2-macroglobulin family protein [Roseibium sp.]MCV0427337.1 alpha-2-macroglobulin family protein [Roseibium sp.]